MTDAPFTETHRKTLLDMREHFIPVRQSVAITAALAEIDRLQQIVGYDEPDWRDYSLGWDDCIAAIKKAGVDAEAIIAEHTRQIMRETFDNWKAKRKTP